MRNYLTQLWLLLCVFTLGGTLSAGADELMLFGDATTLNDCVPFYGYYYDMYNAKSWFVYPAELVEEMSGGQITAVTFYASQNGGVSGGEMLIKAGEVDAATASSTEFTGLTEVWRDALEGGLTTFRFEFAQPLDYNGGNLAFEFSNPTPGTCDNGYNESNRTRFYGAESASAAYCRAGSKGIQNFLPRILIEYTAGEKQDYSAQVSAEALAFGELTTGTSKTLSFTIRNNGLNAFTPSLSGLSAPFSSDYVSASLAAGERATINVTYAPTTTGSNESTLTVNCGDAGSFEVALTGSAVNALTVADGTATNKYIPFFGLYMDTNGTESQMIYPADDLANAGLEAGCNITTLTFYMSEALTKSLNPTVEVRLGETDATTISSSSELSSNRAAATLCFTGNVLQFGEQVVTITLDTPYAYEGGNLLIDTYVTVNGDYQSREWYGVAAPSGASYNNKQGAQAFLPKVQIAFEPVEAEEYAFSARPESIDFGTALVGEPVLAKQVTVKNTGLNTIIISANVDEPFGIAAEDASFSLEPGESKVVAVNFAPTAGDEFSGALTLSNDDAGEKVVELAGKAIAIPTGYREGFDDITAQELIPAGWKAYVVSSREGTFDLSTLSESASVYSVYDKNGNHGIQASGSNYDYNNNPSGYRVLVSPELSGNVFVRGLITGTSGQFLRVYKVVDGVAQMASTSDALAIDWDTTPSWNAEETFSNGTLYLEEPARLVFAIAYAAIDMVAADAVQPLQVAPQSLDFGTVFAGGDATLNVNISNIGAEDLTVSLAGLETPFSVDAASVEVPAGAAVEVPVTFAPAEGGEFADELSINDGAFTVSLTGKSIVIPAGYAEDFAEVTASAKTPAEWRIAYTTGDAGSPNGTWALADMVDDESGFDLMTDDGNYLKRAQNYTYVFSSREYHNYYLVTPTVKGNLMLKAKRSATSSYYSTRIEAYKVNADGTFTVTDDALPISWEPALNANEWSYGSFSLPEGEEARVAILVHCGSIAFFAADEKIDAPDVHITALTDVPETVVANEGVAHIEFTANLDNKGSLAVAAEDYAIEVFASDDLEHAICSTSGVALAAANGEGNQTLSFDYVLAEPQPSQTVTFVVKETACGTSMSTSAITITAEVPVGKLCKEDGTTALTGVQEMGVFKGEKTLTVKLANIGSGDLVIGDVLAAEGFTVDGIAATDVISADDMLEITIAVATPGVYEDDAEQPAAVSILTNAGDFDIRINAVRLGDAEFFEDFEDDLTAEWSNNNYVVLGSRTGATEDNQRWAYTSSYSSVNGELITPAICFGGEAGNVFSFTSYQIVYSVATRILNVAYSADLVNWTSVPEADINVAYQTFNANHITMPDGVYYIKFTLLGTAIDDLYGGIPYSMTLAELLESGVVGENAAVTDELTVVSITEDDQHAYVKGESGAWVRIDAPQEVLLEVAVGQKIQGFSGVLTNKDTAPAMTWAGGTVTGEAADVSALINEVNLSEAFDMPAASSVIKVTGYYEEAGEYGTLRGWDGAGQSLVLAAQFCNAAALNFETNKQYTMTVAIELDEPWNEAAGAPRRARSSHDYDFQNLKGQLVSATGADAPMVTAIDALVVDGKPVAGVTYYNMAGQQSNKAFEGVNIVVTRFTDGTKKTTKVIF